MDLPTPRYSSSSKRSAWKRPKPKVYECNERDAARFYEASYNEYKRNKEDAETRKRTESSRDILAEHPLSWRAASATRERAKPSKEEEKSRIDPWKREGSLSRFSSAVESKSEGHTRLNSQSATDRDESYQDRLEKLKKLREELGLPTQNGTDESSSTALSKSSAKETSELSFNRASSTVPSKSFAKETSESSFNSSYLSTGKIGSIRKLPSSGQEDDEDSSYTPRSRRAQATPSKDEEAPKENKWSKYSSYREKRAEDPEPEFVDPQEYTHKAKSRSDGWRAKLADDLSKCDLYDNIDKERKSPAPFSLKKNDFSFKPSTNGDVNGESSFSSRSAFKSDFSSELGVSSKSFSAASASSSSYKSKAVGISDDLDTDDSVIELLSKKLPSSAEIMERINKMNLDD